MNSLKCVHGVIGSSTPLASQLCTSLYQNSSLDIWKALSSNPLGVSHEDPSIPTRSIPKVWQWRVRASSLAIDPRRVEAELTGFVSGNVECRSVLYFFLRTSLAKVTACSSWLHFPIEAAAWSVVIWAHCFSGVLSGQGGFVERPLDLLSPHGVKCSAWLVLLVISPSILFQRLLNT